MKRRNYFLIIGMLALLIAAGLATPLTAKAWTPTPVDEDTGVRMPGTQPGDVTLPDYGCNCHDFTSAENTSPVTGWRGSMMAQSGRDFLFLATMTVAAQDSIWALGNPNATDICIRCHFPVGWVNGHSDPTNASLMEKGDFDGVQCTLCHYIFDPFFEDTYAGTREGSDWAGYWDEATSLSADKAAEALLFDQGASANFSFFNGDPFFDVSTHTPPSTYHENASGQFFVGSATNRRGSYADTTAPSNHDWVYSRYHKSKYFCATCHDISNPALANLGQDGSTPLTSETDSAYSYYHVERTFSEFMLSDFGVQGGAEGLGPFAPDVFDTSQPGNKIASCQDCHMHDVTGVVVDSGGVLRPTDSTEHPNSGISVHDLTGGSVWVPSILASTNSASSNYDATNASYLDNREDDLTLDLSTNQSAGFDDPDALVAGADRSLQMLQMAAVITDVLYSPYNGNLSFVVQNQTGHKLISGYPEGRRMFINIKYYDENGDLVYEVNPYDENAGTLKGLSYPYTTTLPVPATMTSAETYVDELVYEMHGSTTFDTTEENATFHFVLSDGRYKDNRIPPKGFDIDNAAARLSEPVWHGASDLDYFTAEEYAGGYDQVSMDDFDIVVTDAVTVEVTLNYQTTSREYVEFLRDEINGTGNLTLSGTGAGGDPAYTIQTDSFFDGLRAWGDTIWDIWVHNMDDPGAAPIEIAAGQWDYSMPTVFDYEIEPGDVTLSSRYNAIVMSLNAENAFTLQGFDYDAQGLMDYIGSSVQQVLRLNPARQDFDTWFSGGFGVVDGIFTTTPYPLDTGGVYWVLVDDTAPTIFSLFGDIPSAGSISFSLVGTDACSYNAISIPLDQSSITNAAELATDIGDLDQVLQLNPVRQDFDTWFVGGNFGVVGGVFTTNPDDFPVQIGYPYWVCVTAAGDGKVWPNP